MDQLTRPKTAPSPCFQHMYMNLHSCKFIEHKLWFSATCLAADDGRVHAARAVMKARRENGINLNPAILYYYSWSWSRFGAN